jgi:hypothetical protein
MSATCLQNFVVTVVWKNYQSPGRWSGALESVLVERHYENV